MADDGGRPGERVPLAHGSGDLGRRTAGRHLSDLGSEWGESAEERSGSAGRRLLHAARLLRDPERYIAQFGAPAYEIMLGDCLWHVYAMIGKLTRRVYTLTST